MNETDSHGFALDQAANDAAQKEDARAVRAFKLPVADPLKEAKAILTDALCHNPRHDHSCQAAKFAAHNRILPATHPAWKLALECDCWVGRMAAWLDSNQE